MNTVQRIAKNTGVLLISRIASYLFGFFFIMYTARYLGAAGFGILSFALAFTGIFGVFSDLGLQQSGMFNLVFQAYVKMECAISVQKMEVN